MLRLLLVEKGIKLRCYDIKLQVKAQVHPFPALSSAIQASKQAQNNTQ